MIQKYFQICIFQTELKTCKYTKIVGTDQNPREKIDTRNRHMNYPNIGVIMEMV